MLEEGLVRKRSRAAKSLWLSLVERRNLEGAAAVHFTSERERREAARFGYRFRREAVIANGVDLPGDSPLAASASPAIAGALADPRPYLLFLGRVSWKKGLDRIVRALPRVEGLRLAGNDEEGHWPSVAALVRRQGIEGRVTRVGMVRGDDKRLLLAGAVALVVPSYSENFGNVVLEAMAEGCPVVATPEVGAGEILEREGAGVVVAGDPAALGSVLAALSGDPERRRLFGERGRAAAARHSWAAAAERMATLYDEVCGRR
jgi:glycosyltransferase involved in cell wall biosynthesis